MRDDDVTDWTYERARQRKHIARRQQQQQQQQT